MDNTNNAQSHAQYIKPFATYLITQLIQSGVIAKDVGGSWKLTQGIFGVDVNTAFSSRDELVARLVGHAMTEYGQSGLRVAS